MIDDGEPVDVLDPFATDDDPKKKKKPRAIDRLRALAEPDPTPGPATPAPRRAIDRLRALAEPDPTPGPATPAPRRAIDRLRLLAGDNTTGDVDLRAGADVPLLPEHAPVVVRPDAAKVRADEEAQRIAREYGRTPERQESDGRGIVSYGRPLSGRQRTVDAQTEGLNEQRARAADPTLTDEARRTAAETATSVNADIDRAANDPQLKERIATRMAMLRSHAGAQVAGRESAPDKVADVVTDFAAAAPKAAEKVGQFFGQYRAGAPGPGERATPEALANPDLSGIDDADVAAASGLPRVENREALVSGAQLAAMGLGPVAGRLAGRFTAGAVANAISKLGPAARYSEDPAAAVGAIESYLMEGGDHAIARGVGGTVEHGTSGGLIGASFDPEHPGRGAAIGATLGIAGNELARAEAGYAGSRRVPSRPSVETDPARILPSRSRATVAPEAVMPAAAPDYEVGPANSAESAIAEVQARGQRPAAPAPTPTPTPTPAPSRMEQIRQARAAAEGLPAPAPVGNATPTPPVTPPEALAVRVSPIGKDGAYFSRTGGAVDPGAVPYDLSQLNLANGADPAVARQILVEASFDPALTPAQHQAIEAHLQASEQDPTAGTIDYALNNALPIPAAAKRLGYDGIHLLEADDAPAQPTSVFIWNIRHVQPGVAPVTKVAPAVGREGAMGDPAAPHDAPALSPEEHAARTVDPARWEATGPTGKPLVGAPAPAPASDEVRASSGKSEPERIGSAAIMAPDRSVHTGAIHVDAVRNAEDAGALAKGTSASALQLGPDHLDQGAVDGFVTTHGRFVDRAEAERIADAQDQIDHSHSAREDGVPGELDAMTLKGNAGATDAIDASGRRTAPAGTSLVKGGATPRTPRGKAPPSTVTPMDVRNAGVEVRNEAQKRLHVLITDANPGDGNVTGRAAQAIGDMIDGTAPLARALRDRGVKVTPEIEAQAEHLEQLDRATSMASLAAGIQPWEHVKRAREILTAQGVSADEIKGLSDTALIERAFQEAPSTESTPRSLPKGATPAQSETPGVDGLPIRVSPDDLPLQQATDAYRWNSMSPERRGKTEQTDYVNHIRAVHDAIAPHATTPEQKAALAEELERYRQGYLERLKTRLAATGRTASPMVTGPAKFPTARNEKALKRERTVMEEMNTWSKRAQAAMRKRIAPESSDRVSSDDPDAIETLTAKLAEARKLQDVMKAANKIVRDTKLSPEQRHEQLVAAGVPEAEAREIVTPGRFAGWGYPSFRLTNHNANIKRMEQRIASLSASRAQTGGEVAFDGGRLVDNVADNRVQIFYDEKPAPALRNALRAAAFKRAPSVGAWQRQRTANARAAAEQLVGARLPTAKAAPLASPASDLPAEFDTPEIRAMAKQAAEIPRTDTIDTPERNAWRAGWVDDMAKFTKAGKVAHLVLGLPGSGKTSVLADPLVRSSGGAYLDNDRVKEDAPEWQGGLGGTALHPESVAIRFRALQQVLAQGGNLVFPTVGDEVHTVALATALLAEGYTVHAHLADIPPDVAVRRMLDGVARGTRVFVAPRSILDRGDQPRRAFAALATLDGVIAHDPLDNAVPRGTAPQPVPDWRERWGFPDAEPPGGAPALRPRGGPDGGRLDGGAGRAGPEGAGGDEGVAPGEDQTGTGRVEEDGVTRFESARTPSGVRRPVARVATRGLLNELLDMEQRRADAENRSVYELREDTSFATSGFPQIVSTKPKGGGPSRQAKALRNLEDFDRITDEILGALATRMPKDEIWDAMQDARAERDERDERAGAAGDHPVSQRGTEIHGDDGKVIFEPHADYDLSGEPPAPSPDDQTSMFGETAGTEAARSLSQTEHTARAELDVLRVKVKGAAPEARARMQERITLLEKLVNRDKKIGGVSESGADEYETRAAPFYSRLERAIERAPFQKGTAQQWKAAIGKDVAQGEREWTKIDAFLDRQTGGIRKADVLAHAQANGVHVNTIDLGGGVSRAAIAAARNRLYDEQNALQDELWKKYGDGYKLPNRMLSADTARYNDLMQRFEDLDVAQSNEEAKFAAYTEPGGDDYTERLLQLDRPYGPVDIESWALRQSPDIPDINDPAVRARYDREAASLPQVEQNPIPYRSGHWPAKDVLAHIRFKMRTIDGEKVLHVEEIQSDWHQAGRRHGYQGSAPVLPDGWAIREVDGRFALTDERGGHRGTFPTRDDALAGIARTRRSAEQPPDAPFKKTEEWTLLAVKHAIEEAVQHGATRIMWTNGDRQSVRFDISKDVDHLSYRDDTGTLIASQHGTVVHTGHYDPKALADVIGKEAAERLLAAPREAPKDGWTLRYDDGEVADPTRRYSRAKAEAEEEASKAQGSDYRLYAHPPAETEWVRALQGDDLKAGGGGMRAFYDTMLPKAIGAYGKKIGIPLTMESVHLRTSEAPFPSFRIPSELARKVKAAGQAIYEPKGRYGMPDAAQTELFTKPTSPAVQRADVENVTASFGTPEKAGAAATQLVREAPLVVTLRAKGLPVSPDRIASVRMADRRAWVDLRGKTINDPATAAQLLHAFRNPRMERMHVLLMDAEGTVLSHAMVTSGAIGTVRFGPDHLPGIIARAKRLGAVRALVAHNHPSGDPTPSADDKLWTGYAGEKLQAAGIDLDGHLVIDHTSASWITPAAPDNGAVSGSSDFGVGRMAVAPLTIPGVAGPDWTDIIGAKANRPEIAAALVRDAVSDDGFAVLYLNSLNQALALEPHSARALATIAEWLPKHLKGHAARSVILAARPAVAHALAKQVNPTLRGNDDWARSVRDVIGLPPVGDTFHSHHRSGRVDANPYGGPAAPAARSVFEEAVPYDRTPARADDEEDVTDAAEISPATGGPAEARRRGLARDAAGRVPTTDGVAALFSPAAPGTALGAQVAQAQGQPTTGPAAARAAQEVRTLAQIARSLGQMVDLPVRTGRFLAGQRKASGVFFPDKEVARVLRMDHLGTVAHEIGHYVSMKYLRNPTRRHAAAKGAPPLTITMRRELVKMGKDLYGSRKPNGGYGEEGIAQWAKFYVTDPARLAQDAPDFAAWMEQTILPGEPALKAAMDQARADLAEHRAAPATARIDAMIDTKPAHRFLPDPRTLHTAILDDLYEIRRAVEALGQSTSPAKNAYLLARLSRGGAGLAEEMIERGIVDPVTKQRVTTGIAEVLDKLTKEDVQPFRRYLVAERALEVAARGIDSGISVADARAVVARYETQFRPLAEQLWAVSNALVDYRQAKGLLTTDEATEIKKNNARRVGFYRVFDEHETAASTGSGRGFGRNSSGMQQMKGSARQIVDPLESIITDVYKTVQQSHAAEVLSALVKHADQAQGGGRVVEVLTETPKRRVEIDVEDVKDQLAAMGLVLPNGGLSQLSGVLAAFEDVRQAGPGETKDLVRPLVIDGQRQWIQVNDAKLYNALSGLGTPTMPAWLRFFSIPTRTLRAGATLTLEFMARNPVKDAWTAAIYSRAGTRPPGWDLAKGLFHVLRADHLYQDWRLDGGDNAAMLGLDRVDIRKHVAQLMRSKGREAADWVLRPIDTLRMLGSLFENATRIGEYASVRGKLEGQGMPTADARVAATMSARDVTIDFNKSGDVVRQVNQLVEFFNANVQGWDKLYREFKHNPGTVIPRLLAFITLPSLLLWYLQKDDPAYQEVPAWQKMMAWVIVQRGADGTVKHIWRIPKPPELGILFGSIPERVADYVHRQDPHALHGIGDALQGLNPLHLPTAIKPLVEWWANKSTFTDRPIVPEGVSKLPPAEQSTSRTGEMMRLLGQHTNLSPAKLENTVKGYTGGLGTYGLDIGNQIVRSTRQALHLPALPHATERRGDRAVSLPLAKGFMVREPQLDAESVQQALDAYEAAHAHRLAWRRRIESGDRAGARVYFRDHEQAIRSVAGKDDGLGRPGYLADAHALIVDAQQASRDADEETRSRIADVTIRAARAALDGTRASRLDRLRLHRDARRAEQDGRRLLLRARGDTRRAP